MFHSLHLEHNILVISRKEVRSHRGASDIKGFIYIHNNTRRVAMETLRNKNKSSVVVLNTNRDPYY